MGWLRECHCITSIAIVTVNDNISTHNCHDKLWFLDNFNECTHAHSAEYIERKNNWLQVMEVEAYMSCIWSFIQLPVTELDVHVQFQWSWLPPMNVYGSVNQKSTEIYAISVSEWNFVIISGWNIAIYGSIL